MSEGEAFDSGAVFAGSDPRGAGVPRVFGWPGRYVQGEGVLDHLGRYLSILPSRRAAVLVSKGGQARLGERIAQSFRQAGVGMEVVTFGGECSIVEIERAVDGLGEATDAPTSALSIVYSEAGAFSSIEFFP